MKKYIANRTRDLLLNTALTSESILSVSHGSHLGAGCVRSHLCNRLVAWGTVVLLCLAVTATGVHAQKLIGYGKDDFFGVYFNFFWSLDLSSDAAMKRDVDRLADRIEELNVGSFRMEVRWSKLFAAKDVKCTDVRLKPKGLREYRYIFERLPKDVRIIVHLGETPPVYHAEDGRVAGYCAHLYSKNPKLFISHFKKYIEIVLSEFKGYIDSYEIWLEPNNNNYYLRTAKKNEQQEFHGWTAEEYVKDIFVPAARLIRTSDPDAEITVGLSWDGIRGFGLVQYSGPKRESGHFFQPRNFLDGLMRSLRKFPDLYDSISVHPFIPREKRMGMGSISARMPFDDVYYRHRTVFDNGAATVDVLSRYGYRGPIWWVYGVHIHDRDLRAAGRNPFRLQAEHLVDVLSIGHDEFRKGSITEDGRYLHPLSRIIVYMLRDPAAEKMMSGLLDGRNGKPRRAFFEMKKLIFRKGAFNSFHDFFDAGLDPEYWNISCRENAGEGDKKACGRGWEVGKKDGFIILNGRDSGIILSAKPMLPSTCRRNCKKLHERSNVKLSFSGSLRRSNGQGKDLDVWIGDMGGQDVPTTRGQAQGVRMIIGQCGKALCLELHHEGRLGKSIARLRTTCRAGEKHDLSYALRSDGKWKLSLRSGHGNCVETQGTQSAFLPAMLSHYGLRLTVSRGSIAQIDNLKLGGYR